MFGRTTPKPDVPNHDPPIITKAELDRLIARVEALHKRNIRIETRVMRLLEAHGLDGDGKRLASPHVK
jgi:hypothetical protein